MATAVGFGFDTSFLKNLEKADKLIENLLKKNEKLSKGVISAFQQINNQGIVPYVQSLEKQKRMFDLIRESITTSTGRARSGFGDMKREIDNANKSLDVLLKTLYKTSEFKGNLGQSIASLQYAREMQTRVTTRTDGQYWGISAEEVIKRHQEELQAERNFRAQKEELYRQMFDEIARKEKQSLEERKRYEQNVFNESLEKYRRNKEDQAKVDKHYHEQRQRELESTFGSDTTNNALYSFKELYSKDGVKSVDNMRKVLGELKEAQGKVNQHTEDGRKKYKQLSDAIRFIERDMSRIERQSDNIRNKQSQWLNITDQLQRRLALVFSVSQIAGYINKIVKVRGEFELQQKALQAIVQNVDEANKLWDKTVALAVKSPFRVKELVTYTKQLAAYRIETSQLYDTTKRLADVSAGLGVDMQRLILAYGQVRAASFLRGTELRQFTEAGIPMLEELARHFTELEGRAISVGDVFERISKRMVTFQDVAAVFQRMTSEGGVFYDMQAKQSETLKGQISNLHDAIDLMMNDMGKAYDSQMKNAVAFTRSFVENWREIKFQIENVVVALAAWKVANASYILGTKKAATTTLWGNNALKAKIGTTLSDIKALTWQEAKIFGVTKAQFAMAKATLGLQGALRGVGLAMKTIIPLALIAGVFELYRIMTKASREARRLQEDLNNIYNEDTSNLETQTKTFKDLVERIKNVNKGSKEHSAIISELNNKYGDYLGFLVTEKTTYDDLKDSIDGVVNALSKKAQINTLEKALSAVTESTTKDILSLQKTITEGLKKGLVRESGGEMLIPSKREINDFFALYKQKTEELGRTLSRDETNKLLSSYFKEDVMMTGYTDFEKYKDLGETILNQKEKEAEVQEQINSLYGEGVYSSAEARRQYEKLTKDKEKELANETSRIEREKIERKYAENKIKLDVQFEFDDKNEEEQNKIIEYRINELNKKANNTIKDINRRLIESTNELGKDVVDRIYITAQDEAKGLSGIAESFAQAYKSNQEIIKQENALKDAGTVYDEKRIQDAEKLSKGYYKVLEIMGRIDLLEDKKDKKKKEDEVKEQITLIKKMHEEYVKLNKDYDSAEAKQRVLNAYTKLWGEHFSKVGVNLKSRTIDAEKLKNVLSDASLSDDFKNQLKELSESGNYIRTFSDNFVEQIKKSEGFIAKAKDIGDGVYTFGYGDTIGVKKGDEITEQEADFRLRNRLTQDYVKELNSVLEVNKDLILTQEQYNSLLDLTYQGGKGAVMNLVKYARNEDEAIKHINNVYEKVKNVFGEKDAERFGEAFITKFKKAENIYERISMLLQTINLTVNGGQISKDLYKGMQKRSDERSAGFLMGKEFTDALLSSTVESSAFDFTTKQGVASFLSSLRNLASEEGEKIQEVLELAISQFTAEIGVDLKVEEDKRLFDRIEDIFGNYEVSLELEKLNIPPDLAKKLFGIDAVSLDDIRGQILDSFNLSNLKGKTDQEIFDSEEFKNLSKNRQNEVRESFKKENELQQKALKERLNRYSQFLVKGQSEAVRLKIEELRELAKLEEDYQNKRIEKPYYDLAKKGIQDEYKRKQEDLVWDEFTESDTYIRMFEDLEDASTSSIRKMIDKIEGLKDSLKDLDPKNVKEMVDALEKLKDEDAERNPFRAMSENAKEFVDWLVKAKKLKDELKQKEEDDVKAQERLNNAREEYANAYIDYEAISKSFTATQEQKDAAKDRMDAAASELKSARMVAESTKEGVENTEEMRDNLREGALAFAKSISDIANEVKQYTDAIAELAGHFSGDAAEFISGVGGGISSFLGGAGNLASGLASGNPLAMIQGASDIIGGIKNIKGAFDALHDKKNEREIVKQQELVEKLGKQYEKLEKQIEKAYSMDTLQASYQQGEENLKQQISAYDEMIAQEEAKKDTDKDRIKEWQEEQEQLKEQIEELRAEAFSEATGGILDDVKSAAREWTDAWYEAFAETGDGLSGLKDNFKENMLEMVKQQAAMLISGTYLNKWKEQLSKYVNSEDMELTTSEAKAWADSVNKDLPALSEALTSYFNALKEAGIEFQEAGELSGLQRGIQGITESQADVLASYLNSIRFYVSDNNSIFTNLANSINTGVAFNPIVDQLKTISDQTSAIKSLIESIKYNDGKGEGIRVYTL